MPPLMVRDRSSTASRLRLLWDDSRRLEVYVVGTAAIATWLKFAMMVVHWRSPSLWLP